MFAEGRKLSSIFPFRSDFANVAWQHDDFELVTVIATEDKEKPLVFVVTPYSGPSSNFGFEAKTGEEVNEWITGNKGRCCFCFPPEAFGPDALWFMRHKTTGRLLLCAGQAKQHKEVRMAVLTHGVRTTSPSWFWKSKDSKVCLFAM